MNEHECVSANILRTVLTAKNVYHSTTMLLGVGLRPRMYTNAKVIEKS